MMDDSVELIYSCTEEQSNGAIRTRHCRKKVIHYADDVGVQEITLLTMILVTMVV
jgi:hypothetical protein